MFSVGYVAVSYPANASLQLAPHPSLPPPSHLLQGANNCSKWRIECCHHACGHPDNHHCLWSIYMYTQCQQSDRNPLLFLDYAQRKQLSTTRPLLFLKFTECKQQPDGRPAPALCRCTGPQVWRGKRASRGDLDGLID